MNKIFLLCKTDTYVTLHCESTVNRREQIYSHRFTPDSQQIHSTIACKTSNGAGFKKFTAIHSNFDRSQIKRLKTMEKTSEINRIFLAVDNKNALPIFTGDDQSSGADKSVSLALVSEQKPIKRRSNIILHQGQIEKIKTALTLSRNCLKYSGMSDLVRNEALDSIAESQKIIQYFYEPRV